MGLSALHLLYYTGSCAVHVYINFLFSCTRDTERVDKSSYRSLSHQDVDVIPEKDTPGVKSSPHKKHKYVSCLYSLFLHACISVNCVPVYLIL